MAYYNRANLLTEIGDYRRALQDYTAAIQLKPDYSEAYNNRGVLLLKMGHHAAARQNFMTAYRLDPTNRVAYHNQFLTQSARAMSGHNQ